MYDYLVSFPQSFAYISVVPYFWISMGCTTGLAMFVGAIIYDGDLKNMWKGVISVAAYGFMLFEIIFTRVSFNYAAITKSLTPGQAWANITTILVVSFFWILGIAIGVNVSKRYHKKRG